jgi:acetyl-CoA carboxylase biotin carboxyl carrier protein
MPKVDIDTAYIEQLAELLARTGLTEIEICQADTRIRVAKQVSAAVEYIQQAASPSAAAPALADTAAAPPSDAQHPGAISSPMVGTVYLFPEPGAAPFVKVGDLVKEGQTLLIIEAMKTMNPIPSPRDGTVLEILVNDAEPVEFGEPLVVLA